MKRDLPDRTKDFAVRIIRLCQVLDEKSGVSATLGNQLLSSGIFIGANIAEAEGAQREDDILTKYRIAVKDARETQYWLDLITRTDLIPGNELQELNQECSELVAILTTVCNKLKEKAK